MRNRMFASVCLLLIGVNLLVVWYGKKVHAQEPAKSWQIYSDQQVKVIKIQDGDCSLYIAETMSTGGFHSTGIATGQGCK